MLVTWPAHGQLCTKWVIFLFQLWQNYPDEVGDYSKITIVLCWLFFIFECVFYTHLCFLSKVNSSQEMKTLAGQWPATCQWAELTGSPCTEFREWARPHMGSDFSTCLMFTFYFYFTFQNYRRLVNMLSSRSTVLDVNNQSHPSTFLSYPPSLR